MRYECGNGIREIPQRCRYQLHSKV